MQKGNNGESFDPNTKQQIQLDKADYFGSSIAENVNQLRNQNLKDVS